jgi:hypothetical protein
LIALPSIQSICIDNFTIDTLLFSIALLPTSSIGKEEEFEKIG